MIAPNGFSNEKPDQAFNLVFERGGAGYDQEIDVRCGCSFTARPGAGDHCIYAAVLKFHQGRLSFFERGCHRSDVCPAYGIVRHDTG